MLLCGNWVQAKIWKLFFAFLWATLTRTKSAQGPPTSTIPQLGIRWCACLCVHIVCDTLLSWPHLRVVIGWGEKQRVAVIGHWGDDLVLLYTVYIINPDVQFPISTTVRQLTLFARDAWSETYQHTVAHRRWLSMKIKSIWTKTLSIGLTQDAVYWN